ncbi:hypothetical protein X744_13055 [Mesorhizobium sp. LNJC372A00]|nr:hypothetical protein X745_04405 [Mesorhizobium sp. LNJC374B00]ESY58894.1 hypothetical protein X744_13055 [Mesorhizobium sp. LNJC372A00]ESZ62578.1 hypothetical protein X729_10730 [Mesorhizobium sp. L103C131B0]
MMTKDEIHFGQREELHTEDALGLGLSVNDRKVFPEALINAQPINDRLRDTVRRYREATGI